MLLRGSSLRNTDYIYGLVVFTGHETKVMKNSVQSKNKFSKLESQTNKYIPILVLFQCGLSLVAAFVNTIWEIVYNDKFKYLYESSTNPNGNNENNFVIQLFTMFGTWFIVLATLVPVSLLVTLELVKFSQAVFIYWDVTIYDEIKDMNTKVQTSNLNEELGTVHYVFSDKTGTLT